MHCYELTTFTVPVATNAEALPAIRDFVQSPAALGTLLGCWYSELGALNEITVLRRYADANERQAEFQRVLLGGKPYGLENLLVAMRSETYALFPFLPEIEPGEHGPFYEFRTYNLKPSGVAPTIAAWEAIIAERSKLSPLLGALYALDGTTPRFLHIWPWKSLDERLKIRAASVEQGVWPPKGGPAQLKEMRSSIFLPAAFSPLK